MSVSAGSEWERIVECLPQMAWVAYADGATQCVNRLVVQYTGRNEEAHKGWDWLDLIHSDDLAVARKGWAQAIEGGKVLDSEFRIRGHDGVYRWHALRASPMRNNRGEIERWVGTATDIEAVREVERSLVEAVEAPEEFDAVLTALQAAAPIAMGFIDSDFCITHANDELASIDPEAAPEPIGKRIADALPTLWPQIEPVCVQVLESRQAIGNVAVVGGAPAADEVHQWLVSCYAIEAGDEVVGVGIIAVDVTELAQATEFRSAVLSRVADGVIAAGVDGRVVYMNGAAATMLGWNRAEANGRLLSDLIKQSEGKAESETTAGSSITQSGRVDVVRNDGSTIDISYSIVPLGLGPAPDRVVIVFREVSEPQLPNAQIRLLIVDSHALVGEALSLLLANGNEIVVVGTAYSSDEGIALAERLSPDVVLVDAEIPDKGGIATASLVTNTVSDANVVLVTPAYDAEVLSAALEAGCAWILERTDGLQAVLSAVRSAHAGETFQSRRELERALPEVQVRRREDIELLTPREREVLSLISEGMSNRLIAERLGVSANTVRNHVQRILFKLNVHSKLEAIAYARSHQPTPAKVAEETAADAAIQYAVHQASGMVAAQLDVSVTHALNTLAAHAARHGRPLTSVAQDVVARRMRFDVASS